MPAPDGHVGVDRNARRPAGNAADLASEFGGAPSNVVTVTGTGLDPLTLSYATLGLPLSENSIFYPLQDGGTFMVLGAPAIAASGEATTEPVGFQLAPRPWQARRRPPPTSTTPASDSHLGGEHGDGQERGTGSQTARARRRLEAAEHR